VIFPFKAYHPHLDAAEARARVAAATTIQRANPDNTNAALWLWLCETRLAEIETAHADTRR